MNVFCFSIGVPFLTVLDTTWFDVCKFSDRVVYLKIVYRSLVLV